MNMTIVCMWQEWLNKAFVGLGSLNKQNNSLYMLLESFDEWLHCIH